MESALALQSVDPNALEGITSFLAASDEQPFSPSELYLPNDDAKVVDAGRRVSEYRVRTVDFGAYGQQLVHLRHSSEQLNATEVARRGGDKVKVVGIRAC